MKYYLNSDGFKQPIVFMLRALKTPCRQNVPVCQCSKIKTKEFITYF